MSKPKEASLTDNPGVRLGHIHLTIAVLEVDGTMSLGQVLRKLVLKSHALCPERICFIVILAKNSLGQGYHLLQPLSQSYFPPQSQSSAIIQYEIVGILSVVDLLVALVAASDAGLDVKSAALTSVLEPSPLTVQWVHEMKSPFEFDVLNIYAMDGHLIGLVNRGDVIWRTADDHSRLLFDAWEASDLCGSLSEIYSKPNRPHKFIHTFQDYFVYIRGDDTIENAIRLMKTKCIPAVVVLAPFKNDVLGITRPIDLIEGLCTGVVCLQDPVSSCLDPAPKSTRARRFCWSIHRWNVENTVWFRGASSISYPQDHDLSLLAISSKIHAVAMTGEVASRRLPWILVNALGTLNLYHRLYEIASSLPEIPLQDFNQLQLAVNLLGTIPSEREIHDCKSWYQQGPDQDADIIETSNDLVKTDPKDDIISIDAEEDDASSICVARRLPEDPIHQKLLRWALRMASERRSRILVYYCLILFGSLAVATKFQLLLQVSARYSSSVQIFKRLMTDFILSATASFSRIAAPIESHPFGSYASVIAHLRLESDNQSNPSESQCCRDPANAIARALRPNAQPLMFDTQSRITHILPTSMSSAELAMSVAESPVMFDVTTNALESRSLGSVPLLTTLYLQAYNRVAQIFFHGHCLCTSYTLMTSASGFPLSALLMNNAVFATVSYLEKNPLLIIAFGLVLVKAFFPRRKVDSSHSHDANSLTRIQDKWPQHDKSDTSLQPFGPSPAFQPKILFNPFSLWVMQSAARFSLKPHPFLVNVPSTFSFRIQDTSTHQCVLYHDITLSSQGFRFLMQGIQDDFFPSLHNLLDYADQIYKGLDNITNGDIHHTQSMPQFNTAFANVATLPVYIGIDGDDAVLTPWDMVHAVQLAVHLGDSIVDLHFREVGTEVLLSGKVVDYGERLVCHRPFSHRRFPGDMIVKFPAAPVLSEQILYNRHRYRHTLIPSFGNFVAALGLGIYSGLFAYAWL